MKIYDRFLATISALAIIIGGLWSLDRLHSEKVKENELRIQQIKLDIYLEKKAAYYELCEAAAEIAACDSYDEVMMAKKHFIKLYLGKAHLITQLDNLVAGQKGKFKTLLNKYTDERPNQTPYEYFHFAALKLTSYCKFELNIKQVYK